MFINFADMSDEELRHFWCRYHKPTRKDAEDVVGDRRKGYLSICSSLAYYAINYSAWKRCSRDGDSGRMFVYKHSMDLCLDGTPEDVKARCNFPFIT